MSKFNQKSGILEDEASMVDLESSTDEPAEATPPPISNLYQAYQRFGVRGVPDWVPRFNTSNHSQHSAVDSIASASLFTSVSRSQESRNTADSANNENCKGMPTTVVSGMPEAIPDVPGAAHESHVHEERSTEEKPLWSTKLLKMSCFLTILAVIAVIVLVIVALLRQKEGDTPGNKVKDPVQPMTTTPTQTPLSSTTTTSTTSPTQEPNTVPTEEPNTVPTTTPTTLSVSSTVMPLTGNPSPLEPTKNPTERPTEEPTRLPRKDATLNPTVQTTTPPTQTPTSFPLDSNILQFTIRAETSPTEYCGDTICDYAGWSEPYYHETHTGFWYDLTTVSHYIADTRGSDHRIKATWLDCLECDLPETGQLVRPTNVNIQARAKSPSDVGLTGITEGWLRVTEVEIESGIPCSSVGCPDAMHNLWEL